MKNDERRSLWCYIISAKRYALYNLDDSGQPLLRKWSEHGLGHLLNPIDPDSDDRDWIRCAWNMLIREARGFDVARPAWLNQPAMSRITVSAPELMPPFTALNSTRSFADQVKPFGFLLSASVAPFGHPPGVDPQHFHLIAPFESDARRWLKMRWIDRYSRREFRITTSDFAEQATADSVCVRTDADVLNGYRIHPETKSLAPDGSLCHPNTDGFLSRRPVRVHRDLIRFIGKESNRLEDVQAGLIHDIDDVLTEYADARRDSWARLIVPALRDVSRTQLTDASGMSESEIRRVLNQCVRPRKPGRAMLTAIAVTFARERLAAWNITAPRDAESILAAYLEARASRPDRRCARCGYVISGRSPRARYCSEYCKGRARRWTDRSHPYCGSGRR